MSPQSSTGVSSAEGGGNILTEQSEEILSDEVQRLIFAESSTSLLWDNGIYFSAINELQQSQLFFYSYQNKKLTPLSLVSDLYSSRFSLSHDGQYIYMVIGETQDLDIAKLELATIK